MMRVTAVLRSRAPLVAAKSKLCHSSSSSSSAGAAGLTVSEAVEEVSRRLARAGVPEPGLSARHLVAQAAAGSGPGSGSGSGSRDLDRDALQRLETMTLCRLARMPVQYILREWDFRQLSGLR